MLVRVLRDPDGANLDRVQIIKGWLDKDGKTQDRIYDIACAGGREIKNRRCEKPVGNTVNIAFLPLKSSSKFRYGFGS
jgi:hypothetical protein